jgi:hypothetical protein
VPPFNCLANLAISQNSRVLPFWQDTGKFGGIKNGDALSAGWAKLTNLQKAKRCDGAYPMTLVRLHSANIFANELANIRNY